MMKMNSRGYTKDTVVRDAKTPCLMIMRGTEELPVMLHIVCGEVWVTDFDTFTDAGFTDEHNIVPIALNEGWDGGLRDAWLVMEDVSEYGEPGSRLESTERRQMFAQMWKYKTGNELIFKEVA